MGKYNFEHNRVFPDPRIVITCNHLGLFPNVAKNKPKYFKKWEEWSYDSVNRGGVEGERVFLPIPYAPPSKTPKHKLDCYLWLPSEIGDYWDTNKWNPEFWDKTLMWFLESRKAYNVVPIFDCSGFSSYQMIAPGVTNKRYYLLWDDVLDRLCDRTRKVVGDRVWFSSGNELGHMYGPGKVWAKREIGLYNLNFLDCLKRHGYDEHNVLANVDSGWNWEKKKPGHINTQDTSVLLMTGEMKIKDGKLIHANPGQARPFCQSNHGIKSLDHWVGLVDIEHGVYMCKAAKRQPGMSIFCIDFDGVDMKNNVGMVDNFAYTCVTNCWQFSLGKGKGRRTLVVACHPRRIYFTTFVKLALRRVKLAFKRVFSLGRKEKEAWTGMDITRAKVDNYVLPVTKAYEDAHGKKPRNVGRVKYKAIWKKYFEDLQPDPIPDIEPDTEINDTDEIILHPGEKEEKVNEKSWLKRQLDNFGVWIKKLYEKSQPLAILAGFGVLAGIVILLALILTAIFGG